MPRSLAGASGAELRLKERPGLADPFSRLISSFCGFCSHMLVRSVIFFTKG
jgi:hypothetical protein